jgi:hypothetical protein
VAYEALDGKDGQPPFSESSLHSLPQGFVDNPEMRRVDSLPFGLGVDARDAFTGVRVLDPGNSVPNDRSLICLM